MAKLYIHASYLLDKADVKEIKKWALEHDLPMTKLATKLGITYQYLTKILSAKEKCSAKLWQKLKNLGLTKNLKVKLEKE